MSELNIHWPSIIKIEGDDELSFISSQNHWNEYDTNNFNLDTGDILIDSQGHVFSLVTIDHRIVINKTDDYKSLEEILGLVKAHAAQAGSCCVAKLYAPSIPDAYKIVEST